MDAESEQVSPLLASGWVAGGAAGLLKENATGDGEGTVELGAATTIVSGEAAAGDRPWGLELLTAFLDLCWALACIPPVVLSLELSHLLKWDLISRYASQVFVPLAKELPLPRAYRRPGE